MFSETHAHTANAADITDANIDITDDITATPSLFYSTQEFNDVTHDVKIDAIYNPLPHQIKAAFFKATHSRAFDLSTMRTGKTGSTLLALEFLFRTHRLSKALILAPLSCARAVWLESIAKTMPARRVVVATGTKTQKIKALESDADIIVTNYDTIPLILSELKAGKLELPTYAPERADAAFCPDRAMPALVIDELTHYASLNTQRTKALFALQAAVNFGWIWGLTGTPGHDPVKAFAMSKVINPQAVSVRSIYAWREITMYHYGRESWQWAPRACAPEKIKEALSPAILFRKDEIFDLPPVVYTAREAQLTAEQRSVIRQLKADMCAIASDAAGQDEEVRASTKADLVSKILQVACGALYVSSDASSSRRVLQFTQPARVKEIAELVSQSDHKCVIFCSFTGRAKLLAEQLSHTRDERAVDTSGLETCFKVARICGDTPEKERAKILKKFQAVPLHGDGGVDVLIAHPRTTAFGVELSAADLMIFDGVPLSGDFVFGQAVERLSSLKQTSSRVTIAQVYSCPEERKIFNALIAGQQASAAVSKLFDDVVSARA